MKCCEICGVDTTKDVKRCTNGRCGKCHARYCTPGGETTPGHGRLWPAGWGRREIEAITKGRAS